MPYTLVKFILWALLLAVIGGIIGWLLRSLTCRVEMARLRALGGDHAELERLRERSADLDDVTAERDRLRMEIADVRGSSAGTLGFAHTVDPDALAAVSAGDANATVDVEPIEGESDPPVGNLDASDVSDSSDTELSAGLATLLPAVDSDGGTGDGDDPTAEAGEPSPPGLSLVGRDESPAAAEPDLAAARTALGRPVELDDLTVVEGIGPKIAELCAAIGLDTWRSLADADVAALRSMLSDAGTRFKMHKPDSWPEQAELLADGRWDDFVQLTDRLGGGT